MNILFPLVAFYPSTLGGTAQTMYWLGKALVGKNYNVTVVTSNRNLPKDFADVNKWVVMDGMRVRYCSVRSKLAHRLLYNALLSMREVDIVVLSSIFFIPNFFIALAALFTKKKIIWSPRGELFDSAIEGRKSKFVYIKALRRLFSKRTVFHATSEDEAKVLLSNFGSNIDVVIIPNFFEIPPMYACDSEDKYKYLMFLGRIAPIKSLDKLLISLSLSKSFLKSDLCFYIAGVKEEQFKDYYDNLQHLVDNLGLSGRVKFIGPLRGVEKYNVFSKAKFSFLVSESENFGNVVIEALSQGTPVVCSKGTPWASLETSNAGFWVSNQPDDLSKTIDEICDMDDERYMNMRRNARVLSEQFDISKNILKWERIINK